MNKIDGHNILPFVEAKPDAKSPHQVYFCQSKAVRIDNWKLFSGARGKGPQLYDLSKGIGEKNNVATDNPEVVKRLATALDAFQCEMKADGRPPEKL